MCYARVSRVFRRLNLLPVSRFQNFLCPGSDDRSNSDKSGRWNNSSVLSIIPKSTEVETHLSIKLSRKSYEGILRPKSATRTLIKGLMHGPRAISSLR